MPYKLKLKSPGLHPKRKPTYKVTNWPEYNKSLRKRGFPQSDLETQLFNKAPYIQGVSGQQSTYSHAYIEIVYTFYRLFGWGMRQIAGYFEDLWKTKKLKIPTPSFGHLSDLFSALPVQTKQYCDKLVKRLHRGESITLILDSTGMRFDKASHWYEEKYGKVCQNKPWRKLHLAIDAEMNVHTIDITTYESSDIEEMANLIPDEQSPINIESVMADGAYYSIEGVEKLQERGIIPVIPPPSNAVVHGADNTKWHDKIVQYIKNKGTANPFYKKYGYGKRSLVKAQISRIKRCIGTVFVREGPTFPILDAIRVF